MLLVYVYVYYYNIAVVQKEKVIYALRSRHTLITTSLVQKRDHGAVFLFLTRSNSGVACVALRAAVLAIAAANGIR